MGKNHTNDPKLATLRETFFKEHWLSEHISIKYAPAYEEWMGEDGKMYSMILDEEGARLNTLWRSYKVGGTVVIHIKAQHMLRKDGTPALEYEARLIEALRVGKRIAAELGLKVIYVVSGDIHAGCNHTSLAEAGRNWLVDHGVDPANIVMHGKPKNGNDEDYLVADMMDADVNIREVHVVCSVGQMQRSLLCFLSRGWIPHMHPVTYLGLDTSVFSDHMNDESIDAARYHQGIHAEMRGKGFGISPFYEGVDALRAAEQATTARHEQEIVDAAAGSTSEDQVGTMQVPDGMDDPSQYCSMER